MANFMQSLKEINKLRQSAKVLEKKLREERMDFSSRDGRVKGIINGKLEIISLEISPDLLSDANKAILTCLCRANILSKIPDEILVAPTIPTLIFLPGFNMRALC